MTTIHMRMPRSARKLSAIGEKRALALERFDDGVAWALTFVILAAPLCYGAVEDWSIFTMEAMLAALALTWCGRKLLIDDGWAFRSPLLLPATLLCFVGLLQTLFFSSYHYATRMQLILLLAMLFASWMIPDVFSDRVRMKRLIWALVIFTGAMAVFALLQSLSGTQKIYWMRQPRNFSVIFGPYVNHAHYAGLMEMIAPFPIVLALSRRYDTGQRLLIGFAGVLAAGSLLLAGSRGGLVAFLVQMAVLSAFILRTETELSKKRVVAIASVAGLAALGLFFWLASPQLKASIAALKDPTAHMVGGFRLQVLRDSLPMFVDRPLLGWGLGTFEYVFPRYQRFYSDYLINYAHNDYLQLLVETGIAGLAVIVFFFYRFLSACRSGLDRWQHESVPAAKLAAVIGCVGIFVHSLFDFNMHVPANALMFVTIASIATSGVRSQRVSHRG